MRQEEAAHMRVLRICEGDEVEIIDGEGGRFLARITKLIGTQREIREAVAEIIEELPSNEAKVHITLYHGVPKAAKAELVVQKCTELGFFEYVPVQMTYCDVKMSESEKKLNRLGKIALEAVKQCGRSRLPLIQPVTHFKDALESMEKHDALLVPWEKGGVSFGAAVISAKKADKTEKPRNIGIVIGPEGGISFEEIELMKSAGAVAVTLGSRILRTETAAISAVAAAMCLLGQWA